MSDPEEQSLFDELQPLFSKLEQARFTGRLILHLESGEITKADLHHYLPVTEFSKPLPTIEEETEFCLKP
ncbi:MAG: hypothetical protein JXR49_19355 [Acidobacteria bacterium]|nr:hypothetical protein [Acidobacteriota bacterium]